ncbi:hypothetical protein CN100_33535, partial [Sinorhizobium meliloti]
MLDAARFRRRFKLTYGRRFVRQHHYPACVAGTVRNSVRWAMMMKRRESSHGYRERTSGPAPG